MALVIISAIVGVVLIIWIAYEVKNAKIINEDEEFESFHEEAVDFRSVNQSK